MSKENNKMQVDIENLFKQNVNDLSSIKELYKRIEELGEKITQIKYINNTLVKKLKKEYEKLQKIILDENVQIELNNKIDETKTELNEVSSHLDTKTNDYINIYEFYNLVEEGDWTTALQTALNKCYEENKILIIPNGTYCITESINLSSNKQTFIKGNGNAIIKAKSFIEDIFYKDATWGVKGGEISGVILDCNRLAKNGINIECYNRMEIRSNKILNFLECGIKMIDTIKPNGSARAYENIIEKNYIRGLTQGEFDGLTEEDLPEYGILINSTATDNIFINNIIINVKNAGIKTGEGNNIISYNHFYGYPENYSPNYFIETMGQTTIQNNYFDSAKIGIKVDYHDVSITDNIFFWQTNNDFDRGENGCVLLNNDSINRRVIITNNRISYKGDNKIGFDIKVKGGYSDDSYIINNTVPADKFNNIFNQVITRENGRYTNNDDFILRLFNNNAKRWSIERNTVSETGDNIGSDFVIYSYKDDGTKVEQFKINRSTGAITVMVGNFSLNGKGTKLYLKSNNGKSTNLSATDDGQLLFTPLSGESRPTASSLPYGTMFFDKTLGYPIFARGGNWVKHDGTIVT